MAAGWTEVTYNGITFKNCLTRRFEQDVVYDDSGSDVLMHKFTVQVSGIVTGSNGAVDVIGFEGDETGEPAGTFTNFHLALAEQGQAFEMRVGVTGQSRGTVLLRGVPFTIGTRPGSDPNLDVNNGPKVRVISIEHITGNTLFRIDATFEVSVAGCASEMTGNSAGVLSNKWTVTDDLDGNLMTTRTYQGVLRTASAYINPNALRGFCVPILQPGLKRERMSFEVSRDGLSLGWTIVDKEVMYAAPDPATNWHFKYEESTTEGVNLNSRVSIMMEGPRTCSRMDLIRLCAAFAYNRLVAARGVAAPGNKSGIVFHFLSVSEESGSDSVNRIYMDVAGNAVVPQKQNGNMPIQSALGGLENRVGRHVTADDFKPNLPNYNPDLSPGGRGGEDIPLEGPIPMLGAFLCYLQCACCEAKHVGAFVPQTTPTGAASGTTQNVTVRTVETVSDPMASYLSEEHAKALYLAWQMDSTFDLDDGLVAMPIARQTSSAGTSQQQAEKRDAVKVIRLHPEICTRTVRISGERAGERPKLPAMKTFTDANGIKHTRMRRIIKPSTSWRTADGQEMFRADAEYEFVLSRAPDDGEEMDVGENPWDTLGIQRATLTAVSESASGLPDGQA